ncbi:hypothetical protein GGTG_06791 [Gaeumannomyces tritici R3-111a-1]|uniref:Carboxylic ester hydrolase n=1 Tax=Gaeumannomyces tritici (strain R3-111a-1) TaxID=644352 RepID=J3NZU4_GAET3|nr:hypothetical protein GGTG_06791 [Gaeumannomyces tritici R3-111a-1]EJT76877.1 hypothetical protein GGTG_06791 [Gaeumannomyces tritici R3-111a-1]
MNSARDPCLHIPNLPPPPRLDKAVASATEEEPFTHHYAETPKKTKNKKQNNNKNMAATNTASPPRVRLRQGTYEGATRAPSALYPKALAAFLGVPYAQTTAGVNRFRPPRPLPLAWSWTAGSGDEPVPAVAYGEACPGILAPPPGVTAGEDCLNANVFVPAARLPAAMDGGSGSGGGARAPPPPLLPVVVYVHGGGFNMGLGAERDMASFVAWAADDVVGVSFNYRVGPLGFLAPPAAGVVAADEDGDGALNVGLRDQQMLFGWVADNIAAFGGDPANVTVMGMSAGAHSIGHHLIYYGAPDKQPAPFGKAILESGAATARSVLHPTHLRNASQYREFLAAAGVDGDGDGNDYKTVLSRLRALPLSKNPGRGPRRLGRLRALGVLALPARRRRRRHPGPAGAQLARGAGPRRPPRHGLQRQRGHRLCPPARRRLGRRLPRLLRAPAARGLARRPGPPGRVVAVPGPGLGPTTVLVVVARRRRLPGVVSRAARGHHVPPVAPPRRRLRRLRIHVPRAADGALHVAATSAEEERRRPPQPPPQPLARLRLPLRPALAALGHGQPRRERAVCVPRPGPAAAAAGARRQAQGWWWW